MCVASKILTKRERKFVPARGKFSDEENGETYGINHGTFAAPICAGIRAESSYRALVRKTNNLRSIAEKLGLARPLRHRATPFSSPPASASPRGIPKDSRDAGCKFENFTLLRSMHSRCIRVVRVPYRIQPRSLAAADGQVAFSRRGSSSRIAVRGERTSVRGFDEAGRGAEREEREGGFTREGAKAELLPSRGLTGRGWVG